MFEEHAFTLFISPDWYAGMVLHTIDLFNRKVR